MMEDRIFLSQKIYIVPSLELSIVVWLIYCFETALKSLGRCVKEGPPFHTLLQILNVNFNVKI